MIRSFSILFVAAAISMAPVIDKLAFYKAFESDSQEKMESQLEGLKNAKPSTTRDAYIGALTMKRSQFMSTPKEKADIFKEGRVLLEEAIKKAPENGEYRFLRLAIQENVPKVLKYSSDIASDKAIIVKTYKSMDATLRKVVKEYAKQSANLSPAELN